jgi:hypothetical protein
VMEQALREAGFTGVDLVDGVIYARSDAALPEFTAAPAGADWILAQAWPLRATDAQIADWNLRHPAATMDIHDGESRISMRAKPSDLPLWRELTAAMVAQCVVWRRATRQRDEGM